MNLLLKVLPLILPLAVKWVEWEERKILANGVPLSPDERADAVCMGVAHPEKIRLMRVERIPVFNGMFVSGLSRLIPAVSPDTVGLSLRYGVYIRSPFWNDRRLIAHECVHTGQYERHGSIAAFLRAYLTQCIEVGYPNAPMEQEAVLRAAGI